MNYKKASELDRYTIFAPSREKRPNQNGEKTQNQCPLCPENIDTGETVDSIEGERGWQILSIKNKYPITPIHEVIIHSSEHGLTIENMSDEQAEILIRMYYKRYLALKDQGQVVIFCNFGKFAGASLEHPHSQVMVIENSIKINQLQSLEGGGATESIDNVNGFFAVAPEYSEFPYEVWIKGEKKFIDFDDTDFVSVGKLLTKVMKRLITHLSEVNLSEKHYGKPHMHWKEYGVAYNFYISSVGNFYLRIIPKLNIQAGFELATGINVNVVDPAEVNQMLREDL